MTTQEIVSKLWNLCNVLRDDGITYHQYVTELTYILFLKMAKETGAESQIPEAYRWDNLTSKSGIELKKFYQKLLTHLGEECTGRVREIYQGSSTNIDEPKNLEKIITTIINAVDDESTVVISSHLVDELEAVVDSVIFIKEGRNILQGEAEQLREQHSKSIVELYKEIYA